MGHSAHIVFLECNPLNPDRVLISIFSHLAILLDVRDVYDDIHRELL